VSGIFTSVLVANRGEIACRIFRTLRRLDISCVAVYSDADRHARHVREADEAIRLGPARARDSYLRGDAVISAARSAGAQAIHPGYGFLSENADFARACIEAGLVWVGPPPEAISAMGDKISAKQLVAAAGVPVVPGRVEPGMSDSDLLAAALEIGWPVLVKPSAGGGGKGMHVAESEADLTTLLPRARREAAAAFGDDTLFVERFLATPRHIEVQVLADSYGGVVHLGERECSLQRRHQKVVEEAPSVLLSAAVRESIGRAACDTARSVGYVGAGTVEFIVSANAPDEFFFMEMNTRLQVEHPVTEAVTGVDLVEQQILVAAGESLRLRQADLVLRGHAIEARVYAEDPDRGFLPTTGTVLLSREPSGDGLRVDSGIIDGEPVVEHYDPMLAKVIAHGADRAEALNRLHAALADTVILGVTTNVGFLQRLLDDPDVVAGRLDTGLIDRMDAHSPPIAPAVYVAVAVAQLDAEAAVTGPDPVGPWCRRDGWRLGGARAPRRWRLSADGADPVGVTAVASDQGWRIWVGEGNDPVAEDVVDMARSAIMATSNGSHWVHLAGLAHEVCEVESPPLRGVTETTGKGELRSPMPGTVIVVAAEIGASVEVGDPVVVVEAMKMEHTVAAEVAGAVEEILVAPGQSVARDQPLARIRPLPVADGSTSPQPPGDAGLGRRG
jgi:acetyl-CoA/propionyl-CoA carboxylase biotin carboxyl carrier protein